jgi:hypothetical protein
MAILSEAVAVGLAVTLLLGAACMYLYSRLAYTEKRLGMLESVLVDIKMMMEESEEEHAVAHATPVMPMVGMPRPATAAPVEAAADTAADEKFYSSVLEQVGEEAAVPELTGAKTIEEALESMQAEEIVTPVTAAAAVPPAAEPLPSSGSNAIGPNYDAMTRQELATLAEQRGLRVTKRAGRGEIINLLRKSDQSQNASQSTGTENESGTVAGSLFPSAAPLDGGFPVDLGQTEQPLEEATL